MTQDISDRFGKPSISGKTHDAVSIATATDSNVELDVSDVFSITLLGRLAATNTVGDLTLSVRAYDANDAVFNAILPKTVEVAVGVDGADVVTLQQYDLRGIKKIQVRVRNANAGSKVATVSYAGE